MMLNTIFFFKIWACYYFLYFYVFLLGHGGPLIILGLLSYLIINRIFKRIIFNFKKKLPEILTHVRIKAYVIPSFAYKLIIVYLKAAYLFGIVIIIKLFYKIVYFLLMVIFRKKFKKFRKIFNLSFKEKEKGIKNIETKKNNFVKKFSINFYVIHMVDQINNITILIVIIIHKFAFVNKRSLFSQITDDHFNLICIFTFVDIVVEIILFIGIISILKWKNFFNKKNFQDIISKHLTYRLVIFLIAEQCFIFCIYFFIFINDFTF